MEKTDLSTDIPLVSSSDDDWLFPVDKRKWYEKIPFTHWYKKFYMPRTIKRTTVEIKKAPKYVTNKIANTRYTWWNFLPMSLFNQFKYFYNLYFLLNASSQLIPAFKVGMTFTYFAPLVFVVALSICKDAVDEIRIKLRDIKLNNEEFEMVSQGQFIPVKSKDIKVGQLLRLKKGQRVPADLVILQSADDEGTCFIKTDQLDGETDWKFRKCIKEFQGLPIAELETSEFDLDTEAPHNAIYSFIARVRKGYDTIPVSIDNTAWANTILVSEEIVGIVIYTGKETRSSMNRNDQRNVKVGRVDMALNRVSKVLFCIMLALSLLMVCPDVFHGIFSFFTVVTVVRFMVLYSSIIPISIRVNLDISKLIYSFFISTDDKMEGAEVRNSSIPEELGQVQFLLSDKTGTLTKNEMSFKVLSLGTQSYSVDSAEEMKDELKEYLQTDNTQRVMKNSSTSKMAECIKALALCHNVTPCVTASGERYYQASSPDEVALVKFTEQVGVILKEKTFAKMVLDVEGREERFEILNMFPFSSSTKRMGVIVKSDEGIVLYMKGADSIMAQLIDNIEWLGEECGNLAKDGLRTLVFGKKIIPSDVYEVFKKEYNVASSMMIGREEAVAKSVSKIEGHLHMLCITGVEDELQDDVQQSLEMLKRAGIRTWMLTGDKVETALCIAKSTRLVSVDQEVREFFASSSLEAEALMEKYGGNINEEGLIVDGSTLSLVLKELPMRFIHFALQAKSVICCRCMPTQKAEVVNLVKKSGIRTCAIGDGGNDVSMIQAADVGLGIEGKEGKQASMAADFSMKQFSHVTRILLWHGRNSYIRSSDLALFIMHRGMIISIMQAIFSAIFNFAPVALFQGFLLMGYATYYTMFPVLAIVLDERVNEQKVMEFPELYYQLQTKQRLSMTSMLTWVSVSILQAVVIMFLCMFLFKETFLDIVSISFTALILIELINVGFSIKRWNWLILSSELFSVTIYFLSFFFLKSYFDLHFVFSWQFWWKLFVIVVLTSIPFIAKFIYQIIFPPKSLTVENRRWPVSFNTKCPKMPKIKMFKKYNKYFKWFNPLNWCACKKKNNQGPYEQQMVDL
ncbi:cation-transporting ATPase, putative [Entamoeba invadens IP1]|uniref:Phospholipid-transporting ATPase n=1 Tax=Entamoeba invadens IP1 TaxID=370355 RepID=A0A0A1U6Z5_ENTIV|nr:cation-transporting ATPase, putative [Entamoeba invadens IP1]ELP90095.1 cation-transporting ATPase, putative [Entamoeba invadens IP1]|eukprot:XP_004256866.1 cation-transporting ATPase, putative [Entamoeba invadens IP1]